MDIFSSFAATAALRERLEPATAAASLIDDVEGPHPAARKAAVLVALFPSDDKLHLAFIRRSSTLRAHSGEIAFPGGGFEPTDASPGATALREAQEEIGLEASRVEILGVLPPVFTVVSNYLIVPIVAFLPQGLGTIQLQKSEVAELILLPLRDLAAPGIAHTEEWVLNGRTRTVYFYNYGSYCIWGATGRILHMLLETLQLAQ